jgi:molybdopterin-binding protein
MQATDIQTAISNYIKIEGNTLLIDSPEPHQVRIYNVNGQMIKSFISTIGVNNLELAKGAYIISIGDKKAKVMM